MSFPFADAYAPLFKAAQSSIALFSSLFVISNPVNASYN